MLFVCWGWMKFCASAPCPARINARENGANRAAAFLVVTAWPPTKMGTADEWRRRIQTLQVVLRLGGGHGSACPLCARSSCRPVSRLFSFSCKHFPDLKCGMERSVFFENFSEYRASHDS